MLSAVICLGLSLLSSVFADTNQTCPVKPLDHKAIPAELIVFVSFSMPEASLKSLIQDAKEGEATLVLNGLTNDSFTETAKKLHELGGVMDINPTLFEEHGIKAVPTFLLLKDGKEVGRLQGNVSLGFAMSRLQSSVDNLQPIVISKDQTQ